MDRHYRLFFRMELLAGDIDWLDLIPMHVRGYDTLTSTHPDFLRDTP